MTAANKKMGLAQKVFFIILALFMVVQFTSGDAYGKKKKKKADKSAKTEKVKPSGTFSVSPPVFNLDCKDGEKKTITVKVENPSRYPANLTFIPFGLVPKLDGLSREPLVKLPSNNLARSVIIETPNIVIPGNSYKNVSVTLNVPKGLKGTQYAGLSAANVTRQLMIEQGIELDVNRSNEYENVVGVGMQAGLGMTIKCHMVDTLIHSFTLKKIVVNPAKGNRPMDIVATLKNTGNAEISVLPMLLLMDSKTNSIVARLKAVRHVNLFPTSEIDVQFKSMFANVPKGNYKAILSIPDTKYKLPPVEKVVNVK
jgi:hypothetical protein